MANATRTTVPVEKTTVVDEARYTLVLNEDEARTLRDILGRVGGLPDKSRRQHVNAVIEALYGVGFTWNEQSDLTGSLSFLDRGTGEPVADAVNRLAKGGLVPSSTRYRLA